MRSPRAGPLLLAAMLLLATAPLPLAAERNAPTLTARDFHAPPAVAPLPVVARTHFVLEVPATTQTVRELVQAELGYPAVTMTVGRYRARSGLPPNRQRGTAFPSRAADKRKT